MPHIIEEISRTFNEYLLIPGLTTRKCLPENISLETIITKYKSENKSSALKIRIPMVSAAMQSVSDSRMAIELAKRGGLSFIYASQSIEEQCEMIRKVKCYKAGFVESDSNLRPENTVNDLIQLKRKTGHSTIVITENGEPNGRLLGIITSKDVRLSRLTGTEKVSELMTPYEQLIKAPIGSSLQEVNDIMWKNKLNCLPIVDPNQKLLYLTFRKDYNDSKRYKRQLVDCEKRLMVGAAISTWDYKERVPALIKAGVDVVCIDSSDGYSEFQADAIKWIKDSYGDSIKVGGGNVVSADAFQYLVDAGADFVKIGIGGGSICTTREQKGIGRGQATAILDVAKKRDELYMKTNEYIPLCADGGIVHDYHIVLALAMGADFVMLGRYFARLDESPGKKTQIDGRVVKEHWGEGTQRSANWQRYSDSEHRVVVFEEGVDSFVPYAGSLEDNIERTIAKIKSTMISCGVLDVGELHDKAVLTVVSSSSIVEGGAHDLIARPTT